MRNPLWLLMPSAFMLFFKSKAAIIMLTKLSVLGWLVAQWLWVPVSHAAFPANGPGKAVEGGTSTWAPAPTLGFLAPVFSLYRPWLLGPFGLQISGWKIPPPIPSFCFSNKYIFFKKLEDLYAVKKKKKVLKSKVTTLPSNPC